MNADPSMQSSDSSQDLGATIRSWLESDDEGKEILRLLAENPLDGSVRLLQRLGGNGVPKQLSTSVSGGNVGNIINVASAEALNFTGYAPAVSPKYLVQRLRLGWNCFNLGTLISAHYHNREQYPHPSALEVGGLVTEVNDTFATHIAAPLEPMPPRNFLDYFAQRIEGTDVPGATVFRLGGALCLWWQFKGRHGDEIDAELWSAVDDAVTDLGYIFPGATDSLRALLTPLRPGIGQDGATSDIMESVAIAIARPSRNG
jgi:hypothetical protein